MTKLIPKNKKSAYIDTLHMLPLVFRNYEDIALKNILVIIPGEMNNNLDERFYECAYEICTGPDYQAEVTEEYPIITEETTFESLYNSWFSTIIKL